MAQRVTKSLLEHIEKEREGAKIGNDRFFVNHICTMLAQVNVNKFYRPFEASLLQQTSSYYASVAEKHFDNMTPVEFCKFVNYEYIRVTII